MRSNARCITLAGIATLVAAGCCLDTTQSSTSGTGGSSSGTSGGGSTGATTGGPICFRDVPLLHRSVPVGCDGGVGSSDSPNACMEDRDCLATDAGTRVCSCAPASRPSRFPDANVCVPGDCSVDVDCPCGYCSPTVDPNCGPFFGVTGYYCHSAADACLNDGDCDGGYCAYMPQVNHWACGYAICVG